VCHHGTGWNTGRLVLMMNRLAHRIMSQTCHVSCFTREEPGGSHFDSFQSLTTSYVPLEHLKLHSCFNPMLPNAIPSIMQTLNHTLSLSNIGTNQLTFVVLIPRSISAFFRPAATCFLCLANALKLSMFSSTKSLMRASSWPGVVLASDT
jgi:hypothetical protein